ncbi:457_t:CDS:1, partial [Racocetra persica]
YEKAQREGTYASYLTIGQQVCNKHYIRIVESDRSKTVGASNSTMY